MKQRILTMLLALAACFTTANAEWNPAAGNYGVWMTSAGMNPSSVQSVLRSELGLSARQAAAVCERIPCYVSRDISHADAVYLAQKLYNAGADVQVKVSMLERPLTFEAYQTAKVKVWNAMGLYLKYKLTPSGEASQSVETTDSQIELSLSTGDKVEFYGDNPFYYTNSSNYTSFTKADGCYAYGNVMSMISSTGFATLTTLTATNALAYLFYNCTLENHPAKDLMLPATTLTDYCYASMFKSCEKLTRAPELPATVMAPYCYYNMFYGCKLLTLAPALPSTQLADQCYMYMFSQCKALTTAPALPATELAQGCYNLMFSGCTSLTTAPVLPARTLVKSCYYWMFGNCTNLTSITCLADDLSANDCLYFWVKGVSATGTFYKNPECEDWPTGASGIPEGWTVKHAEGFKVDCGLAFTPTTASATSGEPFVAPTLSNPHSLPVTYSSSEPTVATIDASTGEVTLRKPGTTVITASFAGNDDYYKGSASYTLTVLSQSDTPTMTYKKKAVIAAIGQPVTVPELTVTEGLAVSYSSSNPTVATVDAATGQVTALAEGTATITASTEGSLQYAAATACYYVVVVKASDVDAIRCDANGDNVVSITDAVRVVNIILGSGE